MCGNCWTYRQRRWWGRPLLVDVAISVSWGPLRLLWTLSRASTNSAAAAALRYYGLQLLQLFIFHPQLVLQFHLLGVYSSHLISKQVNVNKTHYFGLISSEIPLKTKSPSLSSLTHSFSHLAFASVTMPCMRCSMRLLSVSSFCSLCSRVSSSCWSERLSCSYISVVFCRIST